MNKRVGVFTGNRAEYGLLYPILKELKYNTKIDLKLIVAGSHLENEFGNTLREIENDGFKVDAKVPIPAVNSSRESTPLAIAKGVESMVRNLIEVGIDILVVYADRYEGFAAVIAASQMNIPVAHIEGGDLTEGGALDDSVRHAMSKLSHLHFTTNTQATNRLLAMGEEAWRVHTVGLPALDGVMRGDYAPAEEVISYLNLNRDLPIILFTQHSITTEQNLASEQVEITLRALNEFCDGLANIIITYPNNDAGGKEIIDQLKFFQERHESSNVKMYPSLGRRMYHGVLGLSKALGMTVVCVGNSSSGIKETPAFGVPTVNIGSRQKGRLRADNVIDVDNNYEQIKCAIVKCTTDIKFISKCKSVNNPYWHNLVGEKISEVISAVEINDRLIQKGMTSQGLVNQEGWYK